MHFLSFCLSDTGCMEREDAFRHSLPSLPLSLRLSCRREDRGGKRQGRPSVRCAASERERMSLSLTHSLCVTRFSCDTREKGCYSEREREREAARRMRTFNQLRTRVSERGRESVRRSKSLSVEGGWCGSLSLSHRSPV